MVSFFRSTSTCCLKIIFFSCFVFPGVGNLEKFCCGPILQEISNPYPCVVSSEFFADRYFFLFISKSVIKFFQTVTVLILMYGCTIWTLMKPLEKKLDGPYTKMLCTVLNKSWKQHPTKQQLYICLLFHNPSK